MKTEVTMACMLALALLLQLLLVAQLETAQGTLMFDFGSQKGSLGAYTETNSNLYSGFVCVTVGLQYKHSSVRLRY